MLQAQMMEQESNQLNQHLELIQQNIQEMQELRFSLTDLKDSKNKEILTNIGKRIYLPVEVKKEKVIVEVGNKTYVEKTLDEAKDIVEDQLNRLEEGKIEVSNRIEMLHQRITKMMDEITNSMDKETK